MALVQLHTGCTGLAYFLHKARVPAFDSGYYSCGNRMETPRHVIVHCPREAERREELQGASRRLDLRRLLDTPEGVGVASWWII